MKNNFAFMVLIIILVNVVFSMLAFNNVRLFDRFKFNAYQVKHANEWNRLIAHAFLHANYAHLFVNMFVLFAFGGNVLSIFSQLFGASATIYFLVLYLGGILASSLPALKKHGDNPSYNAVGASGAVAAVLFSHILMLPTEAIYFIFLPIPIPSFLFGLIYLAYEAYMDKKSSDHIAHDAHFWGAVFGLALTALLRPSFVSGFFKQVLEYLSSFF